MKDVKLRDLFIIVLSPEGSWGKGRTLEEALKNAYKPDSYVAYICHPDTKVSGWGSLVYPLDDSELNEDAEMDQFHPVAIAWKGKGVNKNALKQATDKRVSVHEYNEKADAKTAIVLNANVLNK